MYINIKTKQYPISEQEIRRQYSNTSFASPFTPPEEFAVVFPTPQPTFDYITQVARETFPELTHKGIWEQRWEITSRFIEYTDAQGIMHSVDEQIAEAVAADKASKESAIKASVEQATQQRLDDFAKTRNYDNILSAATYANSAVPKFRAEGQYAVEARDATWVKLLQILSDVESGNRPVPQDYTDIEAELPPLIWPV